MKYDFLTDDIVKRKLSSVSYKKCLEDDIVKRIIINNVIEFEFYNKKRYEDTSLSDSCRNVCVVVEFTEAEINSIFLREIRKEKLKQINELCLERK